MAIVKRVNNEGEGDPYYETLGVVTLEDVIEEIIQSEIIDETDTLTDNIRKAPRMLPRQDFSSFMKPDDMNRTYLSAQLSMAAFQFLSTSVEPFQDKYISEAVLQKLIKQNIVVEVNPAMSSTNTYIYKEGVPCDYFVLILQGHVQVSIGREKLMFEGGPFTYYGVPALKVNDSILMPPSTSDSIYVKQEPYIPDFSLKAIDQLQFLRIRRPHYIVARRATMMGRSKHIELKEEEAFNKEWRKAHLANASNSSEPLMETAEQYPNELTKTSKILLKEINWSPSDKNVNMSSASITRADSKDSGWSFPPGEKQADVSEGSSSEVLRFEVTKVDASQEDVSQKGKTTVTGAENGETTVMGYKESGGDRGSTCNVAPVEGYEGNNEEGEFHGSAEFTPLVTGSGDTNVVPGKISASVRL